MTSSLQTPIERRQSIEQICLRLLARREHSRRELLDKLALRGYRQEEVEPVITEIAGQNWQNDERFAECYVRQRLEKGYGPLRIRYELQQRGITGMDIDALADENCGGWLNLLLDVYAGKFADEKQLSYHEWLKRSRFLLQRGFNSGMIKGLPKALNIRISH
jgi:regulatory protein